MADRPRNSTADAQGPRRDDDDHGNSVPAPMETANRQSFARVTGPLKPTARARTRR